MTAIENVDPPRTVVDPPAEVGSLYLDYDGNVYRLVKSGIDYFANKYRQWYVMLKADHPHATSNWDGPLPQGARLIWSPTGGPR